MQNSSNIKQANTICSHFFQTGEYDFTIQKFGKRDQLADTK